MKIILMRFFIGLLALATPSFVGMGMAKGFIDGVSLFSVVSWLLFALFIIFLSYHVGAFLIKGIKK